MSCEGETEVSFWRIDELEAQQEDLLAERDIEQAKLDGIKEQLAEARRHAAETGEYDDRDWFRRAEAAQRATSRTIQKIQQELGRIGRQIKRANLEATWNLERFFKIEAHKVLDAHTFDTIDNLARDRLERLKREGQP